MARLTSLLQRIRAIPLLGEAGLYVIINGIASLFPLLVIPVITRTVTPADYGVYAIFLVGVNLLMPVIGLGFETAAGRRFVDRATIQYPVYVTTGLIMTVVLAGLVYVLLTVAAPSLSDAVPVPGSWFWAWVFVAWSQTIVGLILVLHQMAQNPVRFGLWRIGRALVLNGLILVFVLAGMAGWADLVLAMVIAHGGIAIAALIWMARHGIVTSRIGLPHLRHILQYGTPLVPHMVGAALVTATDRFLLSMLIDDAAAGVYTIGYQVGQVMFLLSQSVNRAWTPWFYGHLEEGTGQSLKTAVTAGYGVAGLYLIAGCGFGIAGWYALPWIFGDVYTASVPVFLWIVAAFVAQGLWSLSASYLYYSQDTVWVSLSSAGAALLNVGLTYFLITMNGLVGAAQGTFLAYTIGFIAVTAVTVRRSSLPWRLRT